jgi:putative transposase
MRQLLGQAGAESLFKIMKTELLYPCRSAPGKEAKLAVFASIEGWYNRRRRHSAGGFLAPCH